MKLIVMLYQIVCYICLSSIFLQASGSNKRRKRATMNYDVVVNIGGSSSTQANSFVTVDSVANVTSISTSSELTVTGMWSP